ncbi:hypothetical protein [Actinomadura atramentaria]|uniref:hypothetical protein n=1 Tax=Actinomadura atramentaria TaxID=1990 RepID=UPI0012F8AE27|nr:hypothetical protein [Actinomadura atramentaria]
MTNVMLSISILEDRELVDVLNARAKELHEAKLLYQYGLHSLTEGVLGGLWGGTKVPACTLFGGAFNYLKLEEYLKLIAQIEWIFPRSVQVFYMDEGDDGWHVYWPHQGARSGGRSR